MTLDFEMRVEGGNFSTSSEDATSNFVKFGRLNGAPLAHLEDWWSGLRFVNLRSSQQFTIFFTATIFRHSRNNAAGVTKAAVSGMLRVSVKLPKTKAEKLQEVVDSLQNDLKQWEKRSTKNNAVAAKRLDDWTRLKRLFLTLASAVQDAFVCSGPKSTLEKMDWAWIRKTK